MHTHVWICIYIYAYLWALIRARHLSACGSFERRSPSQFCQEAPPSREKPREKADDITGVERESRFFRIERATIQKPKASMLKVWGSPEPGLYGLGASGCSFVEDSVHVSSPCRTAESEIALHHNLCLNDPKT